MFAILRNSVRFITLLWDSTAGVLIFVQLTINNSVARIKYASNMRFISSNDFQATSFYRGVLEM
jgi:hypothetical protein